jgi:hypothetical protein
MYDSQFERSDCYSMPQLETANDPKFFRYMISRVRRCIRAGGHAFTDKYRRIIFFLPHPVHEIILLSSDWLISVQCSIQLTKEKRGL